MSDLETLKKLFTDRGIVFTEDKRDEKIVKTALIFDAGSPGVIGYSSGFCSELHFDIDGKLVSIGAWE